jgi:DNA repair exonuclease SbcCD ATPase subunit
MTPEIIAAIVACLMGIAGLIAAITAWVKAKTSTEQIKAERLRTKESRDKDSQDLHDAVMKNTWEISQLKDMSCHRDQVIEQLQQQISILNSTMATTNVKLDTLTEAIKELKK